MTVAGSSGLGQSLMLGRLYDQEAKNTTALDQVNDKLIEAQTKQAEQAGGSIFGQLGSVLGTAAGTAVGGPIGGAIGGSLGGALGNAVGGGDSAGGFQEVAQLKKTQSRLEAAGKTIAAAIEKAEKGKDEDASRQVSFSGSQNA